MYAHEMCLNACWLLQVILLVMYSTSNMRLHDVIGISQ